MGTSPVRRGGKSRWAWLGGATVALLALAACGSAAVPGAVSGLRSPSGPPSTHRALQGSVPLGAGPALCGGISRLRSLTITRTVSLRNQLHFAFPATVAVHDPSDVRAVATAACRLPQLPRVMICPADLDISYRLAFAAGSQAYPVLTVAATGCWPVAGLDGTRQAVPSFWVTLGTAMHLPSPGAAAFGGRPH